MRFNIFLKQKSQIITQMIRSYIVNLEIRLQMIENCIGDIDKYREEGIKEVKTKSSELVSKLHKDTQRKFERIKKAIEKYSDILDVPTTPKQKLQILVDDFEQLKQIAGHFDKIQKLLPNLKTQQYTDIRSQGDSILYFLTTSQLSQGENGKLKVVKYDNKSFYELRNEHREQINQLLELNRRVVNNLNAKLETLMRKRAK